MTLNPVYEILWKCNGAIGLSAWSFINPKNGIRSANCSKRGISERGMSIVGQLPESISMCRIVTDDHSTIAGMHGLAERIC